MSCHCLHAFDAFVIVHNSSYVYGNYMPFVCLSRPLFAFSSALSVEIAMSALTFCPSLEQKVIISVYASCERCLLLSSKRLLSFMKE